MKIIQDFEIVVQVKENTEKIGNGTGNINNSNKINVLNTIEEDV